MWRNGRAKVIAWQLAQKIEKGGLKMTHIDTYLQTLRLSWIKRLENYTDGWQNLFYKNLNIESNEPVWDLDKKSLSKLEQKISNPFWKSVIIAWKKVVEIKSEEDANELLHTPIWNTFFMKNNNLNTLKRALIKQGCVYIKDIINEESKNFLSYNQFAIKFKVKLTTLDFMALIKSIPIEWKKNIESVPNTDTLALGRKTYIDAFFSSIKGSNIAYWWILEKEI